MCTTIPRKTKLKKKTLRSLRPSTRWAGGTGSKSKRPLTKGRLYAGGLSKDHGRGGRTTVKRERDSDSRIRRRKGRTIKKYRESSVRDETAYRGKKGGSLIEKGL